jgi:YHS domain-containing protein
MRFRSCFLVLLMSGVVAGSAAGQEGSPPSVKVLVNTSRQGLALEGHDPVSFFTDARPVLGRPEYTARYQGAEYRFATIEHRAAFEAEPAKYAPQFGGFCAYGASRGYAAPVEIGTWQIVDGRLLLNYSQSVKRTFDAEPAENLRKADANWPGIVEREGKAIER